MQRYQPEYPLGDAGMGQNGQVRRVCRRCLTADMDEKEYFENLHAYIANLDEDLKVDQPLYEKRLSACKECDLLADGMCRACGCYVELRAVMWKNACPYEKWKAVRIADS